MLIFDHIIETYKEPARPSPTRSCRFRRLISQAYEKMRSWDFHTTRKFVPSHFEQVILSSFKIITFLLKTDFCRFFPIFLRITWKPLNTFKVWLFQTKGYDKSYENHFRFGWYITNNINLNFLVKPTDFT